MRKVLTIFLGLALIFVFCVDFDYAKGPKKVKWNVPGDFATIQEAMDSPDVLDGHKIEVGSGYYAGATVTKAVEIKGKKGAVINSGPLPWSSRTFMAGFLFSGGGVGSGASISHLDFEAVEFPVFSRGADDVSVDHCKMSNPIQGVSNWMGSGWNIGHNKIIHLQTANGGGIGIFVGDYKGGTYKDNRISHNEIKGILHVSPTDGGGYNGTGIVIYADFRWGAAGSAGISDNRVEKNKISLVSDTPGVVDVCAVELTDSRNDPDAIPYPVIFNNKVKHNSFHGMGLNIVLTPQDLENWNDISKNKIHKKLMKVHLTSLISIAALDQDEEDELVITNGISYGYGVHTKVFK